MKSDEIAILLKKYNMGQALDALLKKSENPESPEDLAEKGYGLSHCRAFDV